MFCTLVQNFSSYSKAGNIAPVFKNYSRISKDNCRFVNFQMYLKYLNTIFFANDIILWKCLRENTILSKPFDSTARNLLLSECHANRSCFLLARLIYSYFISKMQNAKKKNKGEVFIQPMG